PSPGLDRGTLRRRHRPRHAGRDLRSRVAAAQDAARCGPRRTARGPSQPALSRQARGAGTGGGRPHSNVGRRTVEAEAGRRAGRIAAWSGPGTSKESSQIQNEAEEIMTELTHSLNRTVVIRAMPETVFRYFTDSARWAAWWGHGSTIDARPGGA